MKKVIETKTVDEIEVTDSRSFVQFLFLYREEWNEDPFSWNNTMMAAFIDALPSTACDMLSNKIIEPSWGLFAHILKGIRYFGGPEYEEWKLLNDKPLA